MLCFQCAKTCPYGNVGFGLVAKHAPILGKTLLRPYEAAFVMVALGFVSHEVIGEVKWLDAFFHEAPLALGKLVPGVTFGWIEAAWFLVLFPLAIWVAIAAIAALTGHRGGLGSLLLAAATGAAPVVAIAHLAKAASKICSWGGFLPLALQDPRGFDTMERIAGHALSPPGAFLGLSLVGWAMAALTLAVAWKAWRWSRLIPTGSKQAARAGLLGASLLFGAVLTVWGWPGIH